MSARLTFPLIRHLSSLATPFFLSLPISANQVSYLSLAAGLLSALSFAQGNPLAGALLLLGAYVLDNCDGEVARAKNQCSNFGRRLDSFVDWAMHAAFFIGLGIGTAASRQSELWVWLGGIAALGATINYLLALYFDLSSGGKTEDAPPEDALRPAGWLQWTVFLFRELSRADFCFLVLILVLLDGAWLLLPAGAIGAQVYWGLQFLTFARKFHV
jgi:phosphatidylglycerophosphate synthase